MCFGLKTQDVLTSASYPISLPLIEFLAKKSRRWDEKNVGEQGIQMNSVSYTSLNEAKESNNRFVFDVSCPHHKSKGLHI